MSIGKRLREAIDSSGLKINEFSEVSGIPYRTLQQYLSDSRSPATEALIKICTQTSINIHWLLTGQGVMRRELSVQEEPGQYLSKRHDALLGLFDALNEDQQREILTVAEEKERLNRVEKMLDEMLKKVG